MDTCRTRPRLSGCFSLVFDCGTGVNIWLLIALTGKYRQVIWRVDQRQAWDKAKFLAKLCFRRSIRGSYAFFDALAVWGSGSTNSSKNARQDGGFDWVEIRKRNTRFWNLRSRRERQYNHPSCRPYLFPSAGAAKRSHSSYWGGKN